MQLSTRFSTARPVILPLPVGEGWGEGRMGRTAHAVQKLRCTSAVRSLRNAFDNKGSHDEMMQGFFFYTADTENLNIRVDPKTGKEINGEELQASGQ